MRELPVVTLSSIDMVLRETLPAGLLCGAGDALIARYDADPNGWLRRTVSDRSGVLEDERVELSDDCVTCSLVGEIVATVSRLASRRPEVLVVVLPPTLDPVPVVFGLEERRPAGALVTASLSVLDPDTLEQDLLGSDLLAERRLAFNDEDRRSVGEVLARQLESADVIALTGQATERASALLDHLVGDHPARAEAYALDLGTLLVRRRSPASRRRGDPRSVCHTGAGPRCGVWTLDLQSWRPFHPDRLLESAEMLGAGPVRGRGYFWLPTRQQVMCAWDGAGGQLSVGELGQWESAPATRLVITGTERDPAQIQAAFEGALLTDAELAPGLDAWRDRADGWDDYLGPQDGDDEPESFVTV